MTDNTRNAPIAHEPNSALTHFGTFDPADWLASFEMTGGAYTATDRLNLFICVPGHTEYEISRARQMIVALTDSDKAAIYAHLAAMEA